MHDRIRIESTEDVVTNAKVIYVPAEGDEVDISRVLTGIDISLHVGKVSKATLHTIFVDGHVEASVEEVILRRIRRKRWRWLNRPRRLLDISTMSGRVRSYVLR